MPRNLSGRCPAAALSSRPRRVRHPGAGIWPTGRRGLVLTAGPPRRAGCPFARRVEPLPPTTQEVDEMDVTATGRRPPGPRGRAGLFAIRDVSSLVTETHEAGHELKRAVSAPQLTAMGIGAIIGTGIFVVIGQGVALAGPGVVLSFVFA